MERLGDGSIGASAMMYTPPAMRRAPSLGKTKRAPSGHLALSSDFDRSVLRAAATLQATPSIRGSLLDPMTALYDTMGDEGGKPASPRKAKPANHASRKVAPAPYAPPPYQPY